MSLLRLLGGEIFFPVSDWVSPLILAGVIKSFPKNQKRDMAVSIAQAMHDRVQIENFRKSKLALLFFEAPSHFKIGEKEQCAYAHKEYQEVIKGLASAADINWRSFSCS